MEDAVYSNIPNHHGRFTLSKCTNSHAMQFPSS